MHPQTGSRQRPVEPGSPIFTAVNAFDPISTVRFFEVGTEEAGSGIGEIRIVAAADIGVTDGHLARDNVQEIVEIGPMIDIFQPWAIPLPDVVPWGSVDIIHIEKVAHETPTVAQHLSPFGTRVDMDSHSAHIETFSAFTGHRPIGICYIPVAATAIEEFLAIVGCRNRIYAL